MKPSEQEALHETIEQAERLRNFGTGFAADMKAAGIHVGLGKNPVCVNCGEPWPCSTERASG